MAVGRGLARQTRRRPSSSRRRPPRCFRRCRPRRSGPQFELLFASTSRMLAPGAIAWAHSTSRAISVIQPEFAAGKLAGAAGLVHLREGGRVGEAERQVELLQVADDVRVVVGIDDGDRGPGAEGRVVGELDLVEAVGVGSPATANSPWGRPWPGGTRDRSCDSAGMPGRRSRTRPRDSNVRASSDSRRSARGRAITAVRSWS